MFIIWCNNQRHTAPEFETRVHSCTAWSPRSWSSSSSEPPGCIFVFPQAVGYFLSSEFVNLLHTKKYVKLDILCFSLQVVAGRFLLLRVVQL